MSDIDFSAISITELASLINSKFIEHKLSATLVGGACVSIYSKNQYLSYDLDFVTYENKKTVQKILAELGFKLQGKYFQREDCPFLIDFVSPPVAVGHEVVKKFKTIITRFGELHLLSPTDCVKDRLASFFHWNDKQALEQAILVALDQNVNLSEIKSWAINEKHIDKFNIFVATLRKLKT